MAFNIGMNIVEVDGAGAPAIRGAATSVGAFNVLTQRGRPNQPVRVSNFRSFVEQFGGYFPGGLGAYLIKGFFDNGGRAAYVNRVVATGAGGATPASLELEDGNANHTLTLEAGFRGDEDPGTWGDDLYARVEARSSASSRLRETAAATVTGDTALTGTIDMSAVTSIEVVVDGETDATVIEFSASDFGDGPAQATANEIRDAINGQTSKLVASFDESDQLVLTSAGEVAALTGGWTSLQVTVGHATIGLQNMASPQRGTAAPFTATRTTLQRADDFRVGDVVRIREGAKSATVKLVFVDSTTGVIEWTPNVASAGTYIRHDIQISNLTFDLTIAKGGSEAEHIVETWTGLSMEPDLASYAPRMLNDELRGSRYVTATDAESASTPGDDIPAATEFTRFTPGSDGTPTAGDFVGDQAERTGFYAFDPFDVQLVCCERSDASIVTTALGYCAGRGDCMFVGSVPEGYLAAGVDSVAVPYGKGFQGKKVYGALYGPYIKIFDPAGHGDNPVKFVPPTGHVMGVYARTESVRGIHKAPAGDAANIVGALDVAYRLTDAEHDNLVRNGSINGIRAVPGAGVIVDASRTLSTDTRWLYVNVRLLFNYVKTSLLRGLTWVRQEPNVDRLWRLAKHSSVIPFLMGLYRQGAFGTGSPEEVFTVICDASNNPPSEVDQGNFKIEVYFYPSKPAETIVIVVGQQPSGGAAAEG